MSLYQPECLSDQPLWGGKPTGLDDREKVLRRVKSTMEGQLSPLKFDLETGDWPSASQSNWIRLKKGKAVAVITGQQPCLWGGPSLILHKLITTLNIVRWLESEGVSAVPVFWNASEDHDLQEMLQVGVMDRDRNIETHSRSWSAQSVSAEALPSFNLSEERFSFSSIVRESFDLGETRFAAQFTSSLLHLFGDQGLVVVEPRDLERGSESFWEQVEVKQESLLKSYDESEQRILQGGNSLQAPRRHPLPIFGLANKTGVRLPYAEISSREKFSYSDLRSQGYRASPGALLRPLMAQWALPIAVTVLGPAEAKYHEQLFGGFEVLGLSKPLIWPRLGGTWVPEDVESILTGLGQNVRAVLEESLLQVPLNHHQDMAIRALSAHMRAMRQEGVGRKGGAQALDRLDRDMFSALGRFERGLQKESLLEKGLTPKEGDRLLRFLLPRGVYQERHLGWSNILRDQKHLEQIQKVFNDPFDKSHRIYS